MQALYETTELQGQMDKLKEVVNELSSDKKGIIPGEAVNISEVKPVD